jgi:acyl carrier protein
MTEFVRLLRQVCALGEINLSPGESLDAIEGLDSLRLLQVVAHLEEHFQVEVDIEALNDLTRVGDVLAAISGARRVDASGGPGPDAA